MANTYLQRNMTGSLDSNWTVSMWVKRSEIVRQQMLFSAYNNSSYDTEVFFDGDKLNFRNKRNGSFVFQVKTNRLFRDVNSWYHLVFQHYTAGDSGVYAKIFVNGVQETSLNVNTQGSGATTWNNDKSHSIGSTVNGGADFFNGIISHMHFASTGIYAPTVFGETDATTGEWKIIADPTFTPGTNGFSILMDGNTITDQSANSNNFSLGGGTLTKTEDNPSNVFATFNPLNQTTAGTNVYSSGNTDLTSATNANEFHGSSTLGMTSGKYYAEFKMKSGIYNLVGITSSPSNDARTNTSVRTPANSYGLYSYNGKLNTSTYAASYTTPNIIGVAVDLDNNKIYFSKDGNWSTGSGAWGSSTWSSGTGAFTITDPSLTAEGAYFFAIGDADGGTSGKFSANFGNGYQATTAVSSAGTNASGNGIFEYDVPTGYTALSTKGLNL